ncbi:MAG: hemolysin family protein [Desulfobacterales bacterium]|nr:hemolysin family protein [Desulfobacterales bacterium]MDD4072224.1 hemolysin family protein [Desulfobacterales bacterium]MDD4393693.1 hemolysin family protein [Desulfobacterales bacterium]
MISSQIILLAILLVLSAFFSSSETAFFSISKTKARHIAKQEGRAYALIKKMKDEPHRLLSTVLIGNNVVNIAASALATSLTMEVFPRYAVGMATGIMTLLILVFGEVFPKSIATRNNILIARMAIFPIYWLSILFYPIIRFLNFIPMLTGKIKKTPAFTEEELMTFVEVVEEEGEIKVEEKDLIHKIFDFDDTNASEIMTPRGDMFIIDVNDKFRINEIIQSGFTRIPIIDDEIDNVIGILNIKDLLRHMTAENLNFDQIDIRSIMFKPYFIPENKKLDKLLQQFQKRKNHIAIVVDEHGGIAGLVTLEDVLEELVGEIVDETDREESHIIKTKNQDWIVLGKSDIEEVNERIHMDIPESNEYDTFSGYILDRIGRIPEENEVIPIGNHLVTILEKDGNRIKKYAIKHKDSKPQDTPDTNKIKPKSLQKV